MIKLKHDEPLTDLCLNVNLTTQTRCLHLSNPALAFMRQAPESRHAR